MGLWLQSYYDESGYYRTKYGTKGYYCRIGQRARDKIHANCLPVFLEWESSQAMKQEETKRREAGAKHMAEIADIRSQLAQAEARAEAAEAQHGEFQARFVELQAQHDGTIRSMTAEMSTLTAERDTAVSREGELRQIIEALEAQLAELRKSQPAQVWERDPEQVEILDEKLGEGGFGVVTAGILTDENGRKVKVALKSLPGAMLDKDREAFEKELKTLAHASLHCSGVCRLLGITVKEGRKLLIMKRYQGSLAQRAAAQPGGVMDVDNAIRFTLQMAQSVTELHAARILLADLKPENILLDEYDRIAICDFGLSHHIQSSISAICPSKSSGAGTPNYMAPEQYDPDEFGGCITYKADIWAAGCVLLFLVTGKPPWVGNTQIQIGRRMFKDPPQHPDIPPHLPESVISVLKQCFARQPDDRPDAAALCDTLRDVDPGVAATISKACMQGFLAHKDSVLSNLKSGDVHTVHRGVQEGWKLIDDILHKICVVKLPPGTKIGHGIGSYLGKLKGVIPALLVKGIEEKVSQLRNTDSHQGDMLLGAKYGFANIELINNLLQLLQEAENSE